MLALLSPPTGIFTASTGALSLPGLWACGLSYIRFPILLPFHLPLSRSLSFALQNSPPPPAINIGTYHFLHIAGFVSQIRRRSVTTGPTKWDHMYDLSYFFGFIVAALTYRLFSTVFPVKAKDGGEEMKTNPLGEAEMTFCDGKGVRRSGEEGVSRGLRMEV